MAYATELDVDQDIRSPSARRSIVVASKGAPAEGALRAEVLDMGLFSSGWGSAGESGLDGCRQRRRLGLYGGSKTRDRRALGGDEELLEVPLHVTRLAIDVLGPRALALSSS